MTTGYLKHDDDAAGVVISVSGDDPAGGQGAKGSAPPGAPPAPAGPAVSSIYDEWSPRRRWVILAVIAVAAVLAPFSDTIYLPALTVVAKSLGTSIDLVTTSVSIYMYLVGGAVLFWGPLADRYGRRWVYLSSVGLFFGASFGCALAPTIEVLIAFRALQGATVTTVSTCGQGVVADVFPPTMRGTANGLFLLPMLLGPILGPILGGVLSDKLGWRSTFWALVIFGGVVLAALATLLPETHQWYTRKRLEKGNPPVTLLEAEDIPPPAFPSPLTPLKIVFGPTVFFHMINLLGVYSFMYATITVMPVALAQAPFHLSQSFIGVAYLPGSLGTIFGAPLCGWLSDRLAARYGGTAVRLVPGTLASLLVLPPALAGFGWSLAAGNLPAVLACSFFTGIACSFAMPGMFSWISIVFQGSAAAAMSGVNAVLNLAAASLIQAGAAGTATLGYGGFCTLLAGLQALLALAALAAVYVQMRREREQRRQQLSSRGCSGGGEAAGTKQLLAAQA